MHTYTVTVGAFKFDRVLASNSNEAKRIAANNVKLTYSSRKTIRELMKTAVARRID